MTRQEQSYFGTTFLGLMAHPCDSCDGVTNDVGLYRWGHQMDTNEGHMQYCPECAARLVPKTPSGIWALAEHAAALTVEEAAVEWLSTWTTAPASYDGFGTKRIAVVGMTKHGREVWEVHTPKAHIAWQRGRYYSGGVYAVILTADDLQDQKDFGLVVVL